MTPDRTEEILFLVLAPHKDCLKKIRKEQQKRFAAGDALALSFPEVYPLMRIEKPLAKSLLKRIARDLRAASMETGGAVLCGSKIAAVANMAIRKTTGGGFGVEWEIGPLEWLPKIRRTARDAA